MRLPLSAITSIAFTTFAIIMATSCKQKEPVEILPFQQLPFGTDSSKTQSFFESNGWQKLQTDNDQIIYFMPTASKKNDELPAVMQDQHPPESYKFEVFFSPEGKAVAMIMTRFDSAERIDTFFKTITDAYGLGQAQWAKKSETTQLGNQIEESIGVLDDGSTVFLIMRSHLIPIEEKLKAGLNDEVELRIFPKKYNEGISIDDLSY